MAIFIKIFFIQQIHIRINDLFFYEILLEFLLIRRHDYTFYWGRDNHSHQDTNFNKVTNLYINGTQTKNNVKKYFPNVIELTFDSNFTLSEDSIVTTLNSIVCLSKITKLIIKCFHFQFKQLIHLSSLRVYSIPTDDNVQYEKNELFQKVSNRNMIKSFIIHDYCTLKKIQLLINLFPRLEQLITRMNRKEFLSIMKFLFTKTNYLCFICVLKAPKVSLKEVKNFIKDTKIIGAYEINHIDKKLYLWW